MDNEDKQSKEREEEKKQKGKELSSIFQQVAESKKAPIAKDMVELTHVETKKQEVSQETIDLASRLKEKFIEEDQFEKLSNDELTILEAFMGRRLLLTRIAIITNQSRVPLGIEPFKKAELDSILSGLVDKGYLHKEVVNNNDVYYLTERGKYRVQ